MFTGWFSKSDNFSDTVKSTKSSEGKLINSYENMDDAIQKYHKSYDIHLKNLITLDDFTNFKGLENVFKDIIMKKNFKHGDVDKSNPILVKNYLVDGDITPASFRKQHIIQQVRYALKKYFAPREHQFIKEIDADIGKHSSVIIITTIEHNKHKREIKYTKDKSYILKMSDMKAALKKIIGSAKKHLKNNEKHITINNENENNDKHHDKHHDKNDDSRVSRKKTKKNSLKSRHSGHKNHTVNNEYSKSRSIRRRSSRNSNSSSSSNKSIRLSILSKGSRRRYRSQNRSQLTRVRRSGSYSDSNTKPISTYMTPSQKKKQQPDLPTTPMQLTGQMTPFAPAFSSTPNGATLNEKKDIITQGTLNFAQPIGTQPQNIICEQLDFTGCGNYRDKCYLDRNTNQCKTKTPKPNPFGGPQQNPFGSPQQNPFGSPQPNYGQQGFQGVPVNQFGQQPQLMAPPQMPPNPFAPIKRNTFDI